MTKSPFRSVIIAAYLGDSVLKDACLKTASSMRKWPFRSLIIAVYLGDIIVLKDAHYPTWYRRHFGGVTFGDQNTVDKRRKKRPFSKVPLFT